MTADIKMIKLELILLGLLVFVLPSLETPKIIFWAMYILTFLIRRYIEHGFSFSKPDGITFSVIALFLVSLLSTFINWPLEKNFSGSFDTLKYSALFLCLYHGNYTSRQMKFVAQVMIFGVLAGLFFGLVEYSSGVTTALSFHSAGGTTQSSIYLGMAIITAFGLMTADSDNTFLNAGIMYISLFLMGVAMLYMGSRGAILAILICYILVLLLIRSRKILLTSVALIAAVVASSYFLIHTYPTNINKPDKRERFSVERFQKSDNERLQNWQIAFKKLSTGNDLVWGIGPKNYSTIDPGELGIESAYYQRKGKLNHAHNLFLTQWIEQGLMGLAAMFVFFGLIITRLKKCWPYCKGNKQQWAWVAGLGGLVVPVIAGFFNTPFYQEHAMLAMILMGTMYAETKKAT